MLVAKTEDVILMKAEAKRAKDLEGIKNSLRGPKLNTGYLIEYGEKYEKLEPLFDALEKITNIYGTGSEFLQQLSTEKDKFESR